MPEVSGARGGKFVNKSNGFSDEGFPGTLRDKTGKKKGKASEDETIDFYMVFRSYISNILSCIMSVLFPCFFFTLHFHFIARRGFGDGGE